MDGRDGVPGEPGLDGIPGRNGLDGMPGTNGLPGRNGTDGTPGANGYNGECIQTNRTTLTFRQYVEIVQAIAEKNFNLLQPHLNIL